MTYLEELAHELTAVGIGGRRRIRILAEFDDHLRCDPEVDLGSPADVSRRFADELGTSLARRASVTAFAALAVAGVLFAIAFLTSPGVKAVGETPLAFLAAGIVLLALQVAFVAGVLALARATQRRSEAVVPRAEATLLVRRAAVGLAAGLATMAGFALVAIAISDQAADWWLALTLSVSGVGVAAILAAAPAVVAAAKVRPVGDGPTGGLQDDFGWLIPSRLLASPWRFALLVAAAVAIAIAVAGIVQSDPFDGALRGLADGVACLTGFLLLGRYLGLRE